MGIRHIYTALYLLLLSACTSSTAEQDTLDKDWVQQKFDHAQMFSVWSKGSERVVHVFEGVGSERDTLASYHFSFATSAETETNGRIALPSERIASTSTTHIPYLRSLGDLDDLVGCAYLMNVRDSLLQGRLRSGSLVELSNGTGIDKEQLLIAAPDLVLAFPFGSATEVINSSFDGPVLSVTEYLEPHPLGRAEWIKFFGILTDKEEQANTIYRGIAQRYDSLKMQSSSKSFLPGVFFGSYWQGEWHASGGDSFVARLTKDAGGMYLFEDIPGSKNVNVSLEELLARGDQAHFFGKILHADHEVVLEDLIGSDERLHALIEERDIQLFYGNTAEADLFGQAVVEPDVLLADFIAIFRSQPDSVHSLKYYSRFTK